jgi:arylsulfatase A-like enzyme
VWPGAQFGVGALRRRSLGARSAAALLAAALAAAAAWRPATSEPRPNVILISIDTLRADHLGCYGYRRPTSPNIDEFARHAVLFEKAIAAAPSTLPSHASMLTSLVVPHHGASYRRRVALAPQCLTLAEVLHAHGYVTESWNGGVQLDRVWGLDQGFDRYQSIGRSGPGGSADRFHTTVQAALTWLDRRGRGRPFFLFLHTYEVHAPYTPKPEFRDLFGRYPTRLGDKVSMADLRRFNRHVWPLGTGDLEHIVACYDAEIRSMDRAFGRLMDGLRDRGLDAHTLIVFTSDHGEEFGEHGSVGLHAHTLFHELLRVPLVVRRPRGEYGGARVGTQVSGIDVAPTILDAVGIDPPAVFEGRSLLPAIEGTEPLPPLPTLSAMDGLGRLAVRDGRWKLISPGGLYDLSADPGEQHNLRRANEACRARRRIMREQVLAWAAARPAYRGPTVDPNLDEELGQRLRALGYTN